MRYKQMLIKILSATLAAMITTTHVIPVLGIEKDYKVEAINQGVEQIGEDLITFTFDTYEGNGEKSLPVIADNDTSKQIKVYGYVKDTHYIETVDRQKEDKLEKSLMLTTNNHVTTGSSIITTSSALSIESKATKLDCAMESMSLEGNIAIDFDIMFEDNHSDKALFRGKYKGQEGQTSWFAPSEVTVKEDNKLYIGKKAISEWTPNTWYNLKITFDFTNKNIGYWVNNVKVHEVKLDNKYVGLDTIKFLQIHNEAEEASRSYIDNYRVYNFEVVKPVQETNFLLFENQIQEFISCDEQSSLSLSDKHIKFGDTSLKWTIGENGKIYVDTPIGYEIFGGSQTDQRRETFVVWLYNETPSDEKLSFEFGTGDSKETWFEFGLDFTGWRCAWVMFDRDMEGKASVDMDKLTIKAPASMLGKDLYFSNMILSTPIDARHHTRSEQTPFVNLEGDTKANSHWMSLYAFSKEYKKFVPQGDVTAENKQEVELIDKRFYDYIHEKKKAVAFEELAKKYESYKIEVKDGVISGRSVDFNKAFAALDAFDKDYYLGKFNSINSNDYFKVLYDMAVFYNKSTNNEQKEQAREMFINMFWHLYNQGFGAGSSVGTVHHLGYEMRDYFPALYLMKDELKEAGWLDEATEAMSWFSGLGRIFYENLKADGVNMDVLNTLLESMLSSILMLEDTDLQVELLQEFTEWLTFSCSPKDGLMGPFKYDGIGFHHGGFYPAYTRDGINGLTPMIYLLRGTSYRLPEKQHELVKRAVMNFRLFSNREQFLLSVSGRHPKGTEKFPVTGFKYMALAGSPDGEQEVDEDVAAAYLRLVDKVTNPLVVQFKELGIEKEQAPTGNWAMNYAALGLQRRDEWLVGVRGHSRYLWANETYQRNNLYGRYITHGQIQIMGEGLPVNNKDSGYYHDGWDWNSWPGTTTIHLPMDELKSDVRNVDTFSGFEEMLISDETYAGALDLEGNNGMFAMKLHEHPKYNGSHRARKSVFMFDNRVIALGSDIENTNGDNPTRTTIFQNYLTDTNEPIFINSTEEIKGLGYKHELQEEEVSYLLDNNNNGYLVPKGEKITITRENQESRHQQTGAKTEGEFAKAVIEHGKAPQDETYEYMIAVDTSLEELEDMKERMKGETNSIYTVLQKDRMAHIVKDHATSTTGYALFEANEALNKGNIVGIDTPAMVMTKEEGEKLTLSVCDPDLRLYEGIDKSQYDEYGNQIEVSIYSREWMQNESKMHTLELSLIGGWKLASESTKCRVVEHKNGNTVLAVDCKDGAKVEVILEKDNSKPDERPDEKPDEKPDDKPNERPNSSIDKDSHSSGVVSAKKEHSLQDIGTHWAKEAIEKVATKGLMTGKSEDSFKPDDYLTRAEIAVILDRLTALPAIKHDKLLKDISGDKWYAASVNKMVASGLLTGYEDGTYKPEHEVKRIEVMAVLARAMKGQKGYKDVVDTNQILAGYKEEVPDWAKNEVSWCIVNDLVGGAENKKLELQNPISRAEMATILSEIITQ